MFKIKIKDWIMESFREIKYAFHKSDHYYIHGQHSCHIFIHVTYEPPN